jgi:hypothetical protein
MELSLVKITNKLTGKVSYHAVNDNQYDAMLATGGSKYDEEYDWVWLGDVEVSHDAVISKGYIIGSYSKETTYETDAHCPFCNKDTNQLYTSAGHERDSSHDKEECLECGARKYGFSNEWTK